MFEWQIEGRSFCIRDVESDAEFHTIEDIQKEAWGFNDLDTVPAATLMATQHAGGIVLGAFEGDAMIGFAYGFAAYEQGRASIHSHMLAVRPEYRNLQAGFYLKLAQRECVLEKGLDEVSWTYDPLQSLNAHLNFAKRARCIKASARTGYGLDGYSTGNKSSDSHLAIRVHVPSVQMISVTIVRNCSARLWCEEKVTGLGAKSTRGSHPIFALSRFPTTSTRSRSATLKPELRGVKRLARLFSPQSPPASK